MLKIASQFSGIGSFEQAITNLGIEHENIMAVDFDKYARQTYTANFGEPKHYFVDSYNADYENVENVDVFLSSPPCQSFSLAGKRLGESDPRGLLFFETLRFINCNKPKYFIIENVKGLLSDSGGETFRNWIQLLGQSENGNTFMFPHEDSLMYNLHWKVLNTKNYGLPQNRERVFLIGIRKDLPNDFVFPKEIPLELRLKDLLEESVDDKYYLSEKTTEYVKKRIGVYTDINPNIARTLCAQYSQSINGSFIKEECKYGFYTCKNLGILCNSCESLENYEIVEDSELEELLECYNDKNYIQLDVNGKGQNSQQDRVYFEDKIMGCIPASRTDSKVNIMQSNYRIRKLTVLECFRLQGFPDDYVKPVSSSQLYKQAGNSISVPVIENILKVLLKNHIN